jgi:hypothetical protein
MYLNLFRMCQIVHHYGPAMASVILAGYSFWPLGGGMERWFLLSAFWLIWAVSDAVIPARAIDLSTGIDWEIRNRFRVIREHRHDQFIADFNSYFQRAAASRGLDTPSGKLIPYPSPFQQNLPTRYLPEESQYQHPWFHNPIREIEVRLPSRHEATKHCSWRISDAASPSSPCSKPVVLAASVGPHELSVLIDSRDGRPAVERRLAIVVKDMKFVALGDSFASGEGNPHVTFNQGTPGNIFSLPRLAEWWDHRCHRSLLASSAQTAIMLSQKRRDTSVTYVSYACSGGTISEGLIGTYNGVENAREAGERLRSFGGQGDSIPHFRTDPLPVQIQRAQELLCTTRGTSPCTKSVQPDIVTFTTGGNELAFGPKVTQCAVGRCKFTEEEMRPVLALLRQQYATLAPRISDLNARSVFLVTYPNMTRREDGRTYCGDSPFDFSPDFVPYLATFVGLGISRAEARNAEKVVLDPLNETITAQAALNGWIAVSGFAKNRGFCARPSWFHTVGQADAKQGRVGDIPNTQADFVGRFPSGALHPNVFGHAGMRARLQVEIEKRFP